MKKILSLLLSFAMAITMLGAFGLSASAAVVEKPNNNLGSLLDGYTGFIQIDTAEDLDTVYNTFKNTTDYDSYMLIYVNSPITISKSYDFIKSEDKYLAFAFFNNVTIEKSATLKTTSIEFIGKTSINNGTIILTQPEAKKGGFYTKVDTQSNGLTNNGTIKMLNTDKILCYSETENQYPIANYGTIQTPTGTITFSNGGYTNANGDVYMNPASTGSVEKLPLDINSPTTSGDSNITMSGVAISAPTYTVTIPTSIDFGDCDKAMANDTEGNRIKTINVNNLSITHSNLFANEKQVTVTMNSDFTIKDADNNALTFELYDGDIKLTDNMVILTADPTENDNNTVTNKSLTAKIDKTQIKKSGTYSGTVTFTVAMLDVK